MHAMEQDMTQTEHAGIVMVTEWLKKCARAIGGVTMELLLMNMVSLNDALVARERVQLK